jgi:hypothetical protein
MYIRPSFGQETWRKETTWKISQALCFTEQGDTYKKLKLPRKYKDILHWANIKHNEIHLIPDFIRKH